MNISRYNLIALTTLFTLVALSACAPSSAGPTAPTSTAIPTTGIIAAPTTAAAAQAPTLAPSSAPTTTVGALTVVLGPGRDGRQTGTAVLTPQGEKTQVVINIQPGPAGVPQPAHIHVGSCPGVGAITYPLHNVVDGTSTTIVNDSLQDLLKGGYAINVHKSTSDLGAYVSCGNISSGPSSAVPGTTPGTGGVSATATP